jgi:D-aminoacyl-tRNA deacylase
MKAREYYGSTGENATMIALIQRVSRAQVDVAGATIGSVGRGILALIGIEAGDSRETGVRLVERVVTYRIFPDDAGKMNLDLRQINGDLLLVPQFTLVADTAKGARASFSGCAPTDRARLLFENLVAAAHKAHPRVSAGSFGADMQVSLTNDGPVTFTLRVPPAREKPAV